LNFAKYAHFHFGEGIDYVVVCLILGWWGYLGGYLFFLLFFTLFIFDTTFFFVSQLSVVYLVDRSFLVSTLINERLRNAKLFIT
ncbi:MAG: hypothetical protein Q9M36_08155, partial [Sulfurovum sp.]|nr:hypothetical protein [Sulfurovum sp.]